MCSVFLRVAEAPRVDEPALFIRRRTPNGVRMELLRPPRPVIAADTHVLPMFEGWRG